MAKGIIMIIDKELKAIIDPKNKTKSPITMPDRIGFTAEIMLKPISNSFFDFTRSNTAKKLLLIRVAIAAPDIAYSGPN